MVIQDKVATALRATRLFAGWPDAALQPLLKAAELQRYSKGQTIAERGVAPAGIWIVATGSVTSYRATANGKYFLQGVLWPGDLFGLMPIVDGGAMPLSHDARREALVVFIPSVPLQNALSDSERMRDLAVFVCYRLRVEYEVLFTASAESLSVRLAKYLAFLPRRSLYASEGLPGSASGVDPSPIELTQDELAAMFGVSRQTLNRAISPFLRSGIVLRDGDRIRVVNFRKLLSIIEENERLPDAWRVEILSWDERLRLNEGSAPSAGQAREIHKDAAHAGTAPSGTASP